MAEEIKPLSSEAIAQIAKKMNMTLDDLINDSKKKKKHSTKKAISSRPQRASIKTKTSPFAVADSQGGFSKLRRYMDSRSCPRQEALAHRRSTFHENQLSTTTNAARKSVFHPTRLTAEKVISKPRRSVKWVMGVGYITPAFKLHLNRGALSNTTQPDKAWRFGAKLEIAAPANFKGMTHSGGRKL